VSAAIQGAMNQLSAQSEKWQQTLKDLENQLNKHGQKLLANEVTQLE
jgi:hypothetical protein